MRSLSEFVFDIGYFPIIHESVKQDFLSWYYKGTQTDYVKENYDIEISKLTELAQNAGTDAKKFNQTNKLSELISIFEDWVSKAKIITYYIAAACGGLGGGLTVVGVLEIHSSIVSTAFKVVGIGLGISGVGAMLLLNILIHQIKTNADLVTKFNQELVEMPGDIRNNDRDWNLIVSKFLWNRSLLSPSTHICLVILSIIRTINAGLYGRISAELKEEVQECAGMNSGEFIRRQVRRTVDDRIPSYLEQD
ncbi:hypothetical protein Halru_2050 [Halovivax ruber XH-70]|uniref:Uncharacterized protein n=1 Tax=Halovivax ruber (strain DSM 18193 / JCM 13892 / XH-70) TaxID=797302 RepID=L0ICZ8_HALRX|nr:hypothetical protein [Halovivax ruber]AGB16644.1 hypothetical protein Halru_2050 [Halovivax ruber XH-70]